MNDSNAPRVSIAAIKTAVCAAYGLDRRDMTSPTRTRRVARPRQVAMYLARLLSGQSYPAIGRQFGGRDHTTVLHAFRATHRRIGESPELELAALRIERALLERAATIAEGKVVESVAAFLLQLGQRVAWPKPVGIQLPPAPTYWDIARAGKILVDQGAE